MEWLKKRMGHRDKGRNGWVMGGNKGRARKGGGERMKGKNEKDGTCIEGGGRRGKKGKKDEGKVRDKRRRSDGGKKEEWRKGRRDIATWLPCHR